MIRKISIIIVLGILAACTLNEPKLPKWDTEWALHLPTYDYNMADVIEDEGNLFPDTTDDMIPIIKFSIEDSSDEIGIEEKDLGIKAEDKHASKSIDDVVLSDPPEAFTPDETVQSLLDDLFPGIEFSPGDVLPPYDTVTVETVQHIVLVETFNYIRMNSGEMYINFYHDMFFTIRPEMTIAVYDDSIGHYVGTLEFPDSIKQGDQAESTHLNLAGKFMSNKLRLEYKIPLAGSDTPTPLDADMLSGTFRAGVVIRDLKVSEANAMIPAQSFSNSDGVDVSSEQDHRVISAKVQRGGANIIFKNSLPLAANLQLTFLNLTIGDDTLTVEIPIEPDGTAEEYIDFSGAELSNYKNPGSYIDSIFFRADAHVDATDGYVSIMGADSFAVTVEMDSVFMESFAGELDTIDIEIEPVVQDDLDFFEDIDGNLRLEDLTMIIDFKNDINFEIGVDLSIVGYRKDPNSDIITDSVHIRVQEIIEKSSIQPVTTIIIDDNYSSPSIVDLIELMPTEIKIYGEAKVYGEGSANITDKIQTFYEINSPLSFQITQAIHYEMSTDTIDIDQDTRDMLTEDTYYASVDVDLLNGLPIDASVVLMIAADSALFESGSTEDSDSLITISVQVSAGSVGADGYVSSPTQNNIQKELTKETLQIFKHQPVYFKQWVNIPETPGTIRFRQNDEIEIDALIKIKITIDPEDE